MPRPSRVVAGNGPLVLLALLLVGGCSRGQEPLRSFRLIPIEQAKQLLAAEQVSLVEASRASEPRRDPLPGRRLWRIPLQPRNPTPPAWIPAGSVLLLARPSRLAFRAAAALARTRNQPVYVCIPGNAEERSSLYSVALRTKETPRGRDS